MSGSRALLMPLAVLLMERPGPRRLVAAFTAARRAARGLRFYALVTYPSMARAEHHTIVYDNPLTEQTWVAAVYVAATCGALVASSHRVVRWFAACSTSPASR